MVCVCKCVFAQRSSIRYSRSLLWFTAPHVCVCARVSGAPQGTIVCRALGVEGVGRSCAWVGVGWQCVDERVRRIPRHGVGDFH